MTIVINETNKIYDVTLSKWSGSGYGPDCFSDLEALAGLNIAEDEDGNIHMSKDDFDNLIDWWKEQVDRANNGEETEENILDPVEDENTWELSVEELPR